MPIKRSQTSCKDKRVAMRPRRLKLKSKENRCTKTTSPSTVMATRNGRKQQQQPLSNQQQDSQGQGKKARQRLVSRRACAPRPLKMGAWLRDLLDREEVSGLKWVDRDKRVFNITWVHKSNHNFDHATHSDIFQRYALYRGLDRASDYKASFRCAINSLKDVEQLTKEGAKKGAQAKRTFRFLLPSDPNFGRKRRNLNKPGSKGRKRKILQPQESPASNPSSSGFGSSTEESASSSPSQSPNPLSWSTNKPSPLQSEPSPVGLAFDLPEDVMGNIPSTISAVHQTTLQGCWTPDIFQPIASPVEQEDQKAEIIFLPSPQGITSVSTLAYPEATSPVKTIVFDDRDDKALVKRVEVVPNMQSGGIVAGLPNFSELGVSDTYTPEETITNTKLASGGQFKVREGKNFSLPVPIDLNDFCTSFTSQFQMPVDDIACVPVSHGTSVSSTADSMVEFSAHPIQQADQPQQFSEYNLQSDLDLGQTLEVSDVPAVTQNLIPSNYPTFTPQENSMPLEDTSCTTVRDVQDNNHIVSSAYSDAVATILNNPDPMNDFPDVITTDLNMHKLQNLELPVEVQHIEVPEMPPDYLLAQIEDNFPDIFQIGRM